MFAEHLTRTFEVLVELSITDVHKRWGWGEVHMELILIGTIPAWQ